MIDVTADRLRRGRAPALTPAEIRAKRIRLVDPGPRSLGCAVCGARAGGGPLAILEPIVDHTNGQRITIALCDDCAGYVVLSLFRSIATAKGADPGHRRKRRRLQVEASGGRQASPVNSRGR